MARRTSRAVGVPVRPSKRHLASLTKAQERLLRCYAAGMSEAEIIKQGRATLRFIREQGKCPRFRAAKDATMQAAREAVQDRIVGGFHTALDVMLEMLQDPNTPAGARKDIGVQLLRSALDVAKMHSEDGGVAQLFTAFAERVKNARVIDADGND